MIIICDFILYRNLNQLLIKVYVTYENRYCEKGGLKVYGYTKYRTQTNRKYLWKT